MTSRNVWAVIISLVLLGALLDSTPAAAQDAADETKTEVKPDFKGAVGLGLIGAELGFVIPALAGAKGVWPYIVFPVAGAAGGAVAGYFLLEKGEGHPELAVAALTVGMALAIPALVATVAATAYRPPEQIETARKVVRASCASQTARCVWHRPRSARARRSRRVKRCARASAASARCASRCSRRSSDGGCGRRAVTLL